MALILQIAAGIVIGQLARACILSLWAITARKLKGGVTGARTLAEEFEQMARNVY